jgi:hypothetical protein
MNIRIAIVVDTVDEAIEIFQQLKARKVVPQPQVMVDPQSDSDATRIFDPSYPPAQATATSSAKVQAPTEFKNVSPKWLPSARIGGDTKQAILAFVADEPKTMQAIGKAIKRNEDQTKQLLMLLWSRHEIAFDGAYFRMP